MRGFTNPLTTSAYLEMTLWGGEGKEERERGRGEGVERREGRGGGGEGRGEERERGRGLRGEGRVSLNWYRVMLVAVGCGH